jgi:hypothetical protein
MDNVLLITADLNILNLELDAMERVIFQIVYLNIVSQLRWTGKNVNFNYHTPLKINGINYDYYVFYVENTAEQAVFLDLGSYFNIGTAYKKTDKSEIFYIINETDSQFLTQQSAHNENRFCTLWR